MTVEIYELPPLPVPVITPGHPAFPALCCQLFAQSSRLLRLDNSPVIFRNEDLRRLAAHPEAGQSPPAVLDRSFTVTAEDGRDVFASSLSRLLANNFFTANPPVHKPVRRVLVSHLTPRDVAALEPTVARIAAQLAGELSEVGCFDFCSMFAARLAARSFGDWIGMTAAEMDQAAELVGELNPIFLTQKTVDELRAADGAAFAYMALISKVVTRALVGGQLQYLKTMADELTAISGYSDPERAGLVPDSLGQLLASNLLDGFHTAAVAASSVVYMLLTHREEWSRVQRDHSLTRTAVHEALRLLSPLTVTERYALDDIEYAGVRIPAGTSIVMLWAVGNRDPTAFPDPDRFLLTRHHRHETTFGGGVHVCPGRYIADMIAQVTVREVSREHWRMTLEDAGDIEWVAGSILSQLKALPVTFDPSSRGANRSEKADPT